MSQYTEQGDLVIQWSDNPHFIVDDMLLTGYNREFCVAWSFSPFFIAGLMDAGFLVMSAKISFPGSEPYYVLLPKLHLERSVLFFEDLHIKKSIRPYLDRYELRFDEDFELILVRCLEIHGEAWLTPPLVEAIEEIRYGALQTAAENAAAAKAAGTDYDVLLNNDYARPVSFALYRDGKLVAGEFGIMNHRAYTSYSGYYDESNAGTVQLIKTTQFLYDNGFDFFDLGMPLDYKTALGARNIGPEEFVKLWRDSQDYKTIYW